MGPAPSALRSSLDATGSRRNQRADPGLCAQRNFFRTAGFIFPNYAAEERRLELADSKVFPEPIEGDDLLAAIERAEEAPTDAPDLFHVVDVLQMCCLSRRSGAVQMVKDGKSGLVFLRSGKIVHAETTVACGRDALFELVAWKDVEFAYERSVRPPVETITSAWHEALIDAVTAQKEEAGSRRQSA
jgi:hypothetical protein